jgi:type IV secretion system protein VirD4
VAALPDVVLPLALGGALLAGVSLTGEGGISLTGRGLAGRSHRDPARGARWARRRDLRRLRVSPEGVPPGRLLLGVLPGIARLTGLAAETAQSLVVVGPTQSGKTTSLAVPAILGWKGPVLAASVKSDLLRHTLGTRTHLGQVWCIDPTASTGARVSTWSPLTGCDQWREACRASAELCEAAKSDGTTADGEFWYATAGKLLAPLFVAAALDGRTMADVVRWVDTQEVGEVAAILERAAPPEVLHAAEATWCRDDRTRSSIYTTAETVLAPFAHPPPGPPADGTFEPGALLGGVHTLYLCAPAHDQRRLRGYFTALTQAVLAHAFATATKSGRPLDPPLLVVLDEAAHIAPLPVRRTGFRSSRSGRTWRRYAGGTGPGRRPSSTTTGPSCSCPASPTPTRWNTPAGSSGTRRPPTLRSRVTPRGGARRRRQLRRAGCCRPRRFAVCRGGAPCSSTDRCRRHGCSCGRGGCKGGGRRKSDPFGPREA